MNKPSIFDDQQIDGLSGLQQLQLIVDGTMAGPSMGITLGFHLVAVGEGRAEFEGAPDKNAMNPLGTVHGGWASAILDSALGCAVHTTLSPGERYATLDLKLNLTRALLPGMAPLRAVGTIVTRGRRTAVSEAKLINADGKVCAVGSSTCIIT